ncbi:MAG: CopG family ribbon-helix-helix protein [Thermoproteus sp.]
MVKRISITLDDSVYKHLDAAMASAGETNRSRFIANLVEQALVEYGRVKANFALIVLVFDHTVGEVDKVLTEIQHDYRDVIKVTTHIHLDEKNCAEVVHAAGDPDRIEELARRVKQLKRGLKFVRVVPVAYGE